MAKREGGGRQTKAERKEQARRDRAELQRRMARARRNRLIGLIVAAAVFVAGVGVYLLFRPKTVTPQGLLAQAAAQAKGAGCGPITQVPPYSPQTEDRTHIGTTPQLPTMPPLSSYASIPPASGPHNPTPLDAGVYDAPPPIDQAIHSLEHGAAEIWYDPSVAGPAVDEITKFFADPKYEDHVIVAPYDYPTQGAAGTIPNGKGMALVAWHTIRYCDQADLSVALDFVASYAAVAKPIVGRPYKGTAPEAGRAI